MFVRREKIIGQKVIGSAIKSFIEIKKNLHKRVINAILEMAKHPFVISGLKDHLHKKF
jgi:hypothetical protein